MTFLQDGTGGYLSLVLAGVLMTECWRWLGALVGSRLAIDGPLFQWVRAVATALVAAMVSRMLLFPAGAMAGVPLALRLTAFAAGLAIYFVSRRNIGAGVLGAALVLMAMEAVRG